MKKLLLISLVSLINLSLFGQSTDPVLGIKAHRIHPKQAEERGFKIPYGSLIRSVYPQSAAEKMGLQAFDYVVKVNDQIVTEELSVGEIVDQYRAGEEVKIEYYRAGVALKASAPLSEGRDLDMVHRSRDKDPFLGVSSIHEPLPNALQYGVPVDIVNNSTAQAMGLEDEDIVLKIDQEAMYSWTDLHAAIDNREVGEFITVSYYRDGNIFEESRPIKSRAATHNDHSRPDGPEILGKPVPGLEQVQIQLQEAPIDRIQAFVATTTEEEENENENPEIRPLAEKISFDRLEVFPNPNDGIFNIDMELPAQGRTSIFVFDSNGRRIYENNLGNFSGRFSDRIDIANTAKGTYFLLVKQGERSLSRQLVVQ